MKLLAFSLVLIVAPLPAITIEQAVQEALQNNPGLLAEKLGIPVAETAVITARLRPNPVVSASSDHLDWLGTGFSETNGAGPTETALRIDFPWERGHKREYRVATAGYAQKIAEARVVDSIRRLRLDVTLACIDVLEAKARLDLANDNLKSLEGVVQLNETRLKGGAIPPIELTRSRVAMLQFRSNVKTAELALTTARIRLQTLLGRGAGQTPIGIIDVSDPLKIPVYTEKYWATFDDSYSPLPGRDLAKTLAMVKKNRPKTPLQRITELSQEAQLAAEDENNAKCISYARQNLEL